MKNKSMKVFFAAMLLTIPGKILAQAPAWTIKSGTIQHLGFSQATNFAFRIYLANAGADQLGSCTADFAYINATDDNYQAKASALLSAYAQQKIVTISYVQDSAGYCQIMDMGI